MANDHKGLKIVKMTGAIAKDGRMSPPITPLHKGRTPPTITPKPGEYRGRTPAAITPVVVVKPTPKKK